MSVTGERTLSRGIDDTALSFARTFAAGAVGGGLVGLLVGGVLGRLVTRLLAVTSPESVQGRLTDDIQPVGQISLAGTLQLCVTTVALGAIAGLIYLWVRRVLPPSRRARAGLFAAFTGSIGGAILLHDHPSFDYSVLRPEWLAVVSFVAIPTLFGFLAPSVIDRLEAPRGWARRGPAWLVVGAGVVVLNLALAVVALPVAAAFGIRLSAPALRFWRSDAVTVAGRVLFVLMVAWGSTGSPRTSSPSRRTRRRRRRSTLTRALQRRSRCATDLPMTVSGADATRQPATRTPCRRATPPTGAGTLGPCTAPAACPHALLEVRTAVRQGARGAREPPEHRLEPAVFPGRDGVGRRRRGSAGGP